MHTEVRIKMSRGMQPPEYATDGAAAMDLRAALEEGETVTLLPGERVMIPTGGSIAPTSREIVGIVAARSGLGVKKGIALSNGIGVIDSDYRGEICVGLYNSSREPFEIRRGDRIAQLMFLPVVCAALIPVEELDETERGTGGFGHTGIR